MPIEIVFTSVSRSCVRNAWASTLTAKLNKNSVNEIHPQGKGYANLRRSIIDDLREK